MKTRAAFALTSSSATATAAAALLLFLLLVFLAGGRRRGGPAVPLSGRSAALSARGCLTPVCQQRSASGGAA